MILAPTLIERLDDAVDIPRRSSRRVGVPAVGNHLQVRLFPGEQLALKIAGDLQYQQHPAFIDCLRHIGGTIEISDSAKHPRAVESSASN